MKKYIKEIQHNDYKTVVTVDENGNYYTTVHKYPAIGKVYNGHIC